MKKLLTTIFMAVLAVSAFATVNVETETPTVYHDGSCERVGSMRFIVTNIQDYQSATTDDPIVIQILLTDAAKLCHDLDGLDDGINNWVSLEVDGAGTGWAADEVKARGLAGANYIEVRIEASPGDGATSPNTTTQAWFRLGSTVNIFGANIALNMWTAADPLAPLGIQKLDGTPICVDYTGRVGGADAFMENEFNVISLTTYLGVLGGTQLGVSYSPANPAIAYGGPVNTHNFTVKSDCDKNGNDLYTPDVLLCQCYDAPVDQDDVYECFDLYRVGLLDLNSVGCDVWLEEDEVGMLTNSSVITFTVVDAAGNPLSTIDDGVYFGQGPSAPNPSLTIGASDITFTGPVWGTNHDAAGTAALSDWWYDGLVPTDGICDTSGKDPCQDSYDIYESFSYTVTTASTDVPAQLILSDLYLARHTELGPITAYVKVSWAPYPCGAGGSVILPFPINFVDCPPEELVVPEYYPSYEYFTYFPAFSDGYWWAGLAVTNVSYFTWNFNPHFLGAHAYSGDYVYDGDADVVFYALEEDGDLYMLEAGMLPASGILVNLLSDPALNWTYMGANAGEVAFGDESFWVIVEATPVTPWTTVAIDGFGMIGNGNEGQGTLPRIDIYNVYSVPVMHK